MLNKPIRIPLKRFSKRTKKFVTTCTNLVEENCCFILSSVDQLHPDQFHIVVENCILQQFVRVDMENADEPNLITKSNMAICTAISTNKPITFKLEGKYLVITTL